MRHGGAEGRRLTLGNNLMEIIFSALGILRRKYMGAEDRAVDPMVKNVNITRVVKK